MNEEAQYIWKLGEYTYNPQHGMIPLEMRINRSSSNPIFNCWDRPTINITYGGGPALYPANINDSDYGEIDPILIINEELMETKPIHYYQKRLIGWNISRVVETDMLNQYGGVSTTYGDGRVVIFTAHPEIRPTLNGTVNEYIAHSTGFGIGIKPIRAVYEYLGEHQNISCNWWIHRRTAAWIAEVPEEDLPPCNELMIYITKPYGLELYLNDRAIYNKLIGRFLDRFLHRIGSTMIINDFTFEVYGENCNKVEFYLDDELVKTGQTNNIGYVNYSTNSSLDGRHKISIRGYDAFDNYVSMETKCLFKSYKK